MAIPLLIDTDPAMGTKDSDPEDSFAITFALRSPEVDVVAITVTQGNVPVTHGYSNAAHLLKLLDRQEVPLAAGQYLPLHPERRPLQVKWLENGERRERIVAHAAHPAGAATAVDLIIEASHKHAGQLVIVAIGPLTNIAAALRADPTLPERVKEIWIMGGAFIVGGNHTPFAEFNFWADPEAADEVSRSGIPANYVGLDVCNRTSLTKGRVEAAERGTDFGKFVRESCASWLSVMSDQGTFGLHLYDSLTVAALCSPGLLQLQRSWVTVDTADGVAQGASGAWLEQYNGPWLKPRTEPNAMVALDVNLERFDELFTTRVLSLL
jgi:purine nucleosidase